MPRRVAEAAEASDTVVAVCHPWRHRPEFIALKERLDAGEERLGFLEGRFLIHRLENVGATGYRRSWTDSILWHHGCHLIDLACWLMGGELEASGWIGPVDPRTGTSMSTSVMLERADGASAHLLLTYLSRLKHNEATIATDRESYRLDINRATLATSGGDEAIASEVENCRLVLADFVEACRSGGRPRVTPADVLPAMAAMQKVQDGWDARARGAEPAGAGARPAGLRSAGKRDDHGIAGGLADGDQDERQREGRAHQAGDEGQRVADDRQPAEQQGPDAVAVEPGLGAAQPLAAQRKPGPALEAQRQSADRPIDQRAQRVADGGDEPEDGDIALPGNQQPGQRHLRREGQDGGGEKGRGEEEGELGHGGGYAAG